MRKAISYLLFCSLVFSPMAHAEAKTQSKPVRIQDYFVNPTTDLAWMTEQERATYIAFLYSLRTLVETELSSEMVIVIENEKPKTTSKMDVMLEIFKPLYQVEESEALVGVAIRVAGKLIAKAWSKMGSKATKNAAEKVEPKFMNKKPDLKERAKNATDVEYRDIPNNTPITNKNALVPVGKNSRAVTNPADAKKIGTDVVPVQGTLKEVPAKSGSKVGKALKATGGVGVAAYGVYELATLGDEEALASLEAKKQAAAANATATASAAETAVHEANESATATAASKERRNLEPMEKREGMFCLFGGHASKYVKSGSRIVCPAPEGTVNNPLCKGKGSPSFFCQSMGLSETINNDQVSSKLCIPLRGKVGLMDLSVRCHAVFMDFLNGVHSVNPEALKKLQDEISQGLTKLEQEKGIEDIGFLDYCSDGTNTVNKGRQSRPCQALLQMVEEVKNYKVFENGVKPAENNAAPANDSKPATGTN